MSQRRNRYSSDYNSLNSFPELYDNEDSREKHNYRDEYDSTHGGHVRDFYRAKHPYGSKYHTQKQNNKCDKRDKHCRKEDRHSRKEDNYRGKKMRSLQLFVTSKLKPILMLALVCFISVLPLMFGSDAMNIKPVDIYLFWEHERYPLNIAYDVYHLMSTVIFVYTVWGLIPTKQIRRYASPFLVVSLLGIPSYFLFYSQMVSLLFLPLLLIWIAIIYFKHDHEKRNHAR